MSFPVSSEMTLKQLMDTYPAGELSSRELKTIKKKHGNSIPKKAHAALIQLALMNKRLQKEIVSFQAHSKEQIREKGLENLKSRIIRVQTLHFEYSLNQQRLGYTLIYIQSTPLGRMLADLRCQNFTLKKLMQANENMLKSYIGSLRYHFFQLMEAYRWFSIETLVARCDSEPNYEALARAPLSRRKSCTF